VSSSCPSKPNPHASSRLRVHFHGSCHCETEIVRTFGLAKNRRPERPNRCDSKQSGVDWWWQWLQLWLGELIIAATIQSVSRRRDGRQERACTPPKPPPKP
jgi:hypothetical protein